MITAELSEHLTARLATVMDAHLGRAKDWYPHDYVPWEEAARLTDMSPDEIGTRLPEPVRVSVVLNLLTEDNLPGYHGEIARIYGSLRGTDVVPAKAGVDSRDTWMTWLDRWTAEEGRHAIALRDWLTVTGSVDPVALEDDRMATMSRGFQAAGKDVLRTLAYVSMQELATRVAHRGTGKLSGDAGLERLLSRIATDENLHMVVYRDLVEAALEVDPAQMFAAIVDEIKGFAMPGTGIPGFARRAAVVAKAGIYDMVVHSEQVITPMVRHWQLLERDLPGSAEPDRVRLVAVLDALEVKAQKMRDRRAVA